MGPFLLVDSLSTLQYNNYILKNKEHNMLVQCKKTGRWYDPLVEFRKTMSSPEVIAVLKRMKDK